IDFLLTIDLDLAEFTVLTPFPRTRAFDDLEAEGRILSRDWGRYNAGEVVVRPKLIEPHRLQELFHDAWSAFYRAESQELRMSKLLLQLLRSRRARERAQNAEQPLL
ncbi:MAG: radical SAM protein, partial [bacterium]